MLCFRYKEEASQSWWKARRSKSHLMWMAAGKESLCRHKMNKMSVTTLRPLTPSLLCIKSHIWTLTEPSHVRCSILSFIYSRMSYSWYKNLKIGSSENIRERLSLPSILQQNFGTLNFGFTISQPRRIPLQFWNSTPIGNLKFTLTSVE
nr:uncharacterized protein LOC130541769 isoform X2 [Pan paniscus]